MSFCPSCGKPVNENSKFCKSCGNPLDESTQDGSAQISGPVTNSSIAPVQQPAIGQPQSQTKYCQVCGNLNPAGVIYCQQCGSNQFALTPPARIKRPTGVTILGVIQIILSLVDLYVGLLLAAFLSLFIPGIGIIVLIISLVPLFFAIAFMTGRNWGRILMMIGAVLELFNIPIGTIIGIIILWYLTRPGVVAYFKQPR